jgi:phosphate starvation-inducible PhoH-like protein
MSSKKRRALRMQNDVGNDYSEDDLPKKLYFKVSPEQKEVLKDLEKNDVIVLSGKTGSGKTFLACYYALQKLLNKEVDKIIITRPTVSKEEIGFLPGTLKEKLDPWLCPIYDNTYKISNKSIIDSLINTNQIEIKAVAHMRGITFTNTIAIYDEFQNVTAEQTMMSIGRIGLGSKLIICGDMQQVDLDTKKYKSGFDFLNYMSIKEVPNYKFVTLNNNYRKGIVEDFLRMYDNYKLDHNIN